LSFVCVTIGSLAIIGFPFLAGFYSKDVILELSYSRYILDGLFIYDLAILAALCTAIYSFKLLAYVFFLRNHLYLKYVLAASEIDFFMCVSIFFLSIFSIFVGYFSCDFFIG
jgi:NADH-ubiquinone oxidoreductase chain 5